MAQGSRPERVGDLIRAEITELLAREVRDPGIGFITITRVSVTRDLQLARVHYTSLADSAGRQATTRALDRARSFLRREIGRRLRLKRVPDLQFVFDESIEQQDRIERLLQDLHAPEPALPDTEGGDDTDSDS